MASKFRYSGRALVVFGVTLATTLIAAAFPLLAIASNGDPGGP